MSTTSPPTSGSSHAVPSSVSSVPPSQLDNERQLAEARAVLLATMNNVGSRFDPDLQERSRNLHANTAVISKQETNLMTATKKLAKETDKLKIVADKGLKTLKDAGNLQNFSEVLDRDLLILEETMRLVRDGYESSLSGSESSWESCRICRIEGREERIVLCDGNKDGERCNGPFHTDCLGLKDMPKGPWYCPECRAQNAAARRHLVGDNQHIEAVEDVQMSGLDEPANSRTYGPAAIQQQNGTWT